MNAQHPSTCGEEAIVSRSRATFCCTLKRAAAFLHPLGLDGYIGSFAGRLYEFNQLCDVGAVLLVFLAIPHAVAYSALRMDAMRAARLRVTQFARRDNNSETYDLQTSQLVMGSDQVTTAFDPVAPA